eukprot:1845643-Amphidinium_carterae.1
MDRQEEKQTLRQDSPQKVPSKNLSGKAQITSDKSSFDSTLSHKHLDVLQGVEKALESEACNTWQSAPTSTQDKRKWQLMLYIPLRALKKTATSSSFTSVLGNPGKDGGFDFRVALGASEDAHKQ